MATYKIPEEVIHKFSTIYHTTNIECAFSILRNKEIFGRDIDKQANFGCIKKRFDLAKEQEVTLKFVWPGSHLIYVGDPFVNCEYNADIEFKKPNILYHIYTEFNEREHSFAKHFWQSNLYPGSNGLIFKGVFHLFTHSTSKKQSYLKQLFSKNARKEQKHYEWNSSTKLALNKFIDTQVRVPKGS